MKTSFDIAFDISFLSSIGGIGTYTAQIYPHFIKHHSHRNYLLLDNKIPAHTAQYHNQAENWQLRWQQPPPHWEYIQTQRHSRVAWMLWDLPRLIDHYKPRIFFSLDNVTIPKTKFGCDSVLVLHDLIPITHPQFCRWRDALACRWLIGRAVKLAARIITVSHYSAEQIASRFPQAQSKLTVIENGVDHARFAPPANQESSAQSMAAKYSLYSPRYILIVTTLSPRRNLPQFIHAYAQHLAQTGDKETCLAIAGCRGWKDHDIFTTIQSLELQHRIHFLDYIPDTDLPSLYQGAYALAHPSLLEGFGLTVLEAMACQTPVLCSSTTALGEISANAALHFNPEDTGSMQAAITQLVQNPNLHNELAQKGREHAQSFDWETTAERCMELIDTILDNQ